MKPITAFKLLVSIILCELAGFVGSLFTISSVSTWYVALNKAPLNPPAWVFAPVWTALYMIMGVALFLVWKNDWRISRPLKTYEGRAWNPWSRRFWTGDWQKANIIAVFLVQLLFNTLWSYVFFGLRQPGWAFFELVALWFSVVYVMVNFYRVSKAAAWLLLPYILWITFAAYLNCWIWLVN